MHDPQAQLASELLGVIANSAYFISQKLVALLALHVVRLSLEHGNGRFSSFGYVIHGFIVSSLRDDPATGRRFGQLAIELATRQGEPMQRARALYVHAGFIEHWTWNARAGIPQLAEAYKVLLECGDWQYARHCFSVLCWRRVCMGEPLQPLLAEIQGFIDLAGMRKERDTLHVLRAFRRTLGALTGAPEETTGPLPALTQLWPASAASFALALTEGHVLFRRFDEALALAEETIPLMRALPGTFTQAVHLFYLALSAAAVYPASSGERRSELRALMERQVETLERYARRAPENFSPYLQLARAELARVTGHPAQAYLCYEEAIAMARIGGFTNVEALACELACRFHLGQDRHPLAASYLTESLGAYARWGAMGKARLLAVEHAPLLHSFQGALATWDPSGPVMARPSGDESPERRPAMRFRTDSLSDALDVSSVMKASQAISSELHFPQLAANLVDILLESSGAQRGVLVLQRDGQLFVEASGEVGSGAAPLVPAPRMEQGEALCLAIAEQVVRTEGPVLLDDASAQEPFRDEPYITRRGVRSVLCLPILHRKRLLGLVYLENNLLAGAFNARRLKVLGMLVTQAAISLENAALYRELESSHRTLEQRVRERTEELHHKNTELRGALERLQAMQAQIITQEKLASLGAITAGIAHELKNPLNFVKNFSELSLERVQEVREALRTKQDTDELLEELEQNIAKVCEHEQRASGIINGMLKHSRTHRGERQPVAINPLVEEAVRLVHYAQRARRPVHAVLIDTAFDEAAPPLHLVAEDLRRVILNLLDNGCYAAQEKARRGSAEPPRLKVSTRWKGGALELRVRDNGHGIPAAVREKLFTPFFTTKPAGEGTGLGLSLSHDIVVGLGGTLKVESEEGRYTEFTLLLPGELARRA